MDLTGPAPILERAGAYLRNQDAVQLDICTCTVSRYTALFSLPKVPCTEVQVSGCGLPNLSSENWRELKSVLRFAGSVAALNRVVGRQGGSSGACADA